MSTEDGSRLTILHVLHSLKRESGGTAEAVRSVSLALVGLGHQVEIVTLDQPGGSEAAGLPLPVHALGQAEGGYGFTTALVPWLRKNHPRFDGIVVHGVWQYPGWGTWRALRGTGAAYVVFPHGMLDPWFRETYRLKHVKKLVYWWLREFHVLRGAGRVCFTCEEERRQARRGGFRPYRFREKVVSFGTTDPSGDAEAEQAAFDRRFAPLKGRSFVLFLGRLHIKKGVSELLEAYAAVRAAAGGRGPALVIAGPCADPALLASLKAGADALGLECADLSRPEEAADPAGVPEPAVFWLPMLGGEVKWGALRACEAFVLLSHQENFGIAVAEAMACAKPVLISRKVNIWREVVESGGGLAADDSVAGGVELLQAWNALDAGARARMGRQARVCFLERFEIVRAAEALAETIRDVRAEPAAGGSGGRKELVS